MNEIFIILNHITFHVIKYAIKTLVFQITIE